MFSPGVCCFREEAACVRAQAPLLRQAQRSAGAGVAVSAAAWASW